MSYKSEYNKAKNRIKNMSTQKLKVERKKYNTTFKRLANVELKRRGIILSKKKRKTIGTREINFMGTGSYGYYDPYGKKGKNKKTTINYGLYGRW